MNRPSHKTEGINRTKTVRFYPFVFTGEVPCKEVRTPLNSITFNEERDEETSFDYCNDYQPHAVKRMFDYKNGMLYDMRWDKAGNLGQVSMGRPGEMFERGRFLFWTEDNRMHAAVDEKYFSYYVYDHSGERRLKLTGINKQQDVNADLMATYTVLNEPTLYPSAYMVLTNKGYTKHYYAGTERVAARLGGGGLNALHHVIENDGELQTKADILFKQSLEQVNSRVLNENDLDCIMGSEFAKEEFGHWIEGIPCQMKAEVKCDHGLFKEMVHSMLDDRNHGVYFYHSDHLGSASWITDSAGIAVQHLQYLPYGEPYVDQRTSGYSERFRFTGKEKDEETGYGYFGARYMDHDLTTMWISVDPMSDKYPGISPYAYCAWNPVKLVDPDGREVYITGDEKSKEEALRQIQQKSKNMKFSIAENGKLTFEGKAKTKEEKYMKKIIDDNNVTVKLTVQMSNKDDNGHEITGGSFDGNKFKSEEKNQIYAYQTVDVITANENDLKVGESWQGQTIWHEMAEAYEGGLISIKIGKEASKAFAGEKNSIYQSAHYLASKIFPASPKPIYRESQVGFKKYQDIERYVFE